MSKLIKSVSSEDLRSWGIHPDSQIEYYDGTVLVVDDSEPDGGIATMAKFGCSILFGVAVFTHAPLIGATMFAYAGYKALSTVRSMYGGNNTLASRIERDLGVESVPDGWVPMPQLPEHQPVKITTQLGESSAVPVAHVAVSDVHAQASQTSTPQTKTLDIVDLILSQGNSLVFIGGQGVGKSRLMAISSRVGLQTGRYRRITVLSSLAKANEDPHYWQHAQIQAFCDMGGMRESDRAKALRAFLNAVRQFKTNSNDQNPGLLIIDEIAYLSALLAEAPKEDQLSKQLESEIQDCLRVVSSGGAKRGWFIWLGTPQGAIGDLGNLGKRMKMLKPVLCAISPGDVVQSRGSAVSWDEGLYQAALRNFPALKTPERGFSGRIVFFQDRWMNQTRYPEPRRVAETMPSLNDELDDRARLETSFAVTDSHPIEQFYHTDSTSLESSEPNNGELAIRAEIKRFLLANSEGSKPRDLANKARSPVRKMPVEEIKFYLDVMTLENEIYEVDGVFFANTN